MRSIILFLCLVLCPLSAWSESDPDFERLRQELIREIKQDVRETAESIGRDDFQEKVFQALASVPRHRFVPEEHRHQAYQNRPLPIGYGQTISQPYIVALMTDLLDLEPEETVLEVGTGSGYQAAVLAELVRKVVTVEIIPELAEQAAERFQRLGIENIHAVQGDGYYGFPEEAPFHAIMVTAAGDHIPPPLIKQLEPGGRMVLPVGGPFMVQQLTLVRKDLNGEIHTEQLLPVRFVPLTGGH